MRADACHCLPLVAPGGDASARLTLQALTTDPRTGDVLEGWLTDPAGARWPILDGIAILVPEPRTYVASHPEQWDLDTVVSSDLRAWLGDLLPGVNRDKYDTQRVLDEYLWLHYDGLLDTAHPAALPTPMDGFFTPTLRALSDLPDGPVLDAGCNVGRMTFELARSRFALGFDYSWASIRAARTLLTKGSMTYRKRHVGTASTVVQIDAPPSRDLEFVVADAAAPPVAPGWMAGVVAMNLIDRVPDPAAVVRALDRCVVAEGCLVITDPFSWDVLYTPPDRWLDGPEALIALLTNELGYRVGASQNLCLPIRETDRFLQVSCPALIVGRRRT
ncbi:MAG: methyltransferase domain-containing protein [bacterium]